MVYIISLSVGAPSETASAIFLPARALPFDPYAQPFIYNLYANMLLKKQDSVQEDTMQSHTKKELGVHPFLFPMPVLMIATYGEDGKVGEAWKSGVDLMKKMR